MIYGGHEQGCCRVSQEDVAGKWDVWDMMRPVFTLLSKMRRIPGGVVKR
jgi:hypothetical protein